MTIALGRVGGVLSSCAIMDVTVAAHNLSDCSECTTNVLSSIGFCLLVALPMCRLRCVVGFCRRIIIGSCTFAFLPVGIPLVDVLAFLADCLRSLSMRIWSFTLRVMLPDVSQEDNDLRETW